MNLSQLSLVFTLDELPQQFSTTMLPVLQSCSPCAPNKKENTAAPVVCRGSTADGGPHTVSPCGMLEGVEEEVERMKAEVCHGQIIATSHDLGPQEVAFWKGIPLISGKSRLVKYYNLARFIEMSRNPETFSRCD